MTVQTPQTLKGFLHSLRSQSHEQDQTTSNIVRELFLENIAKLLLLLSVREEKNYSMNPKMVTNTRRGHDSQQIQGSNGGMRPQPPQNLPFAQNQFAGQQQLPLIDDPVPPVDDVTAPIEPHPDDDMPELDPNFQVPDPAAAPPPAPAADSGMGGGSEPTPQPTG